MLVLESVKSDLVDHSSEKVLEEKMSGSKIKHQRQRQSFYCDSCQLYIIGTQNIHDYNVHMPSPSVTNKRKHSRKKTTFVRSLRCYQCGCDIDKKDYIKHLMKHDEQKRKNNYVTYPSFGQSEASQKERERSEILTRRYVYPVNDSRFNNQDSILSCLQCPGQLFSTLSSFQDHSRRHHNCDTNLSSDPASSVRSTSSGYSSSSPQ